MTEPRSDRTRASNADPCEAGGGIVSVGRTIGMAIALFAAAPAIACSGPGPRGHAFDADVIVSGQIVPSEGSDADVIVAKSVRKGIKAEQYKVIWGGMSSDDECAFLSPVFRNRGVYFLKLLPRGEYLIIWTEERWDMRWGKDL